MKKIAISLSLLSLILLSGCETVVDRNGQTRQVITPMGAAIAQTLVSTGVGVGTGALMKNSPSWAVGGVSGGAGSIVSQVANSFMPTAQRRYQPQYQQQPRYYPQAPQTQYRQQQYQPQYRPSAYESDRSYLDSTRYEQQNRGQSAPPLYYRRNDGSFAPVPQQ